MSHTIKQVLKLALKDLIASSKRYSIVFTCSSIKSTYYSGVVSYEDMLAALDFFTEQRPSESQYKKFYDPRMQSVAWWDIGKEANKTRVKFLKHIIKTKL